jgi:phage FluMu gp28-like protein
MATAQKTARKAATRKAASATRKAAPPRLTPLLALRSYQLPVFRDRTSPVQVLHWSRQIGKSFTLASWAVDRLLTRPGRLVVVLSNSKDNGREFAMKAAEVARLLGGVVEELDLAAGGSGVYEEMNYEVRVTVDGKVGRIKVLAANPRTARGFSGDLILDEFAFHQDAALIWDAAEPILASNPDFLCRIASTGNGTGNMFYRMATDGRFPLSRVTRTDAWRSGVKIRSALSGKEITPEQARAEAIDQASYDQNYECKFTSAQGPLLSVELIDTAERPDCGFICEDDWDIEAETLLRRIGAAGGRLAIGYDVARRRHYSVLAVVERQGHEYFARALLRMRNLPLPDQEERVTRAMGWLHNRATVILDATGLGEGPADYLSQRLPGKVRPIHFSSSLPMTRELATTGERGGSAPAPLILAARLLRLHLDGQIRYPVDPLLRADLQKPRRVLTAAGRATIAASDDADGHADHFWALALAGWHLSDDAIGAFTAENIGAVITPDTAGLKLPWSIPQDAFSSWALN